MSQRHSSLDEVINEHNLNRNTTLSAEEVRQYAKKAMVTNSLAYVLADAANSFLIDCDAALQHFHKSLRHEVKQNFRQFQHTIHAARAASKKAAEPMYLAGSGYTDDACIDSDWFYHFIQLLDDRVGTNPQKTQLLLEFLLNMPSEGEGIFNPKYEDFIAM